MANGSRDPGTRRARLESGAPAERRNDVAESPRAGTVVPDNSKANVPRSQPTESSTDQPQSKRRGFKRLKGSKRNSRKVLPRRGRTPCWWISIVALIFIVATLVFNQERSMQAAERDVSPSLAASILKQIESVYSLDKLNTFSKDPQLVKQCHLTQRHERFCILSPFCTTGGRLYTLRTELSQGTGDARFAQAERVDNDLFDKNFVEADFKVRPGEDESLPSSATWVHGLTALMNLKVSAGNVAHFGGRVLFFLHFVAYNQFLGSRPINRVVLLAPPKIHDKLRDRASWHNWILRLVLRPMEVRHITSLGELPPEEPGIFVVNNESNFTGSLCFEETILPAFLKARFFISDSEYTNEFNDNDRMHEDDPREPVSAKLLKHRLYKEMDVDRPQPGKSLVYLKRARRRQFTSPSEATFQNMLQNLCEKQGFKLIIPDLDTMSFVEQARVLLDAGVAVGLHGANLVNTLLMPQGSAMLEIFPFSFSHDMYVDGGNAGVFYSKHHISRGDDFGELGSYNNSRILCVQKSSSCKLFYRSDNREITLYKEDIDAIESDLKRLLVRVKDAASP